MSRIGIGLQNKYFSKEFIVFSNLSICKLYVLTQKAIS